MGEKTSISWTNKTHNFWYGCRKVSAGCKFCYAERDMKRFGKNFNVVIRVKGFDKPLKWKEPAMVFTCSWSDFFIEEADEWRPEAWEIIRKTPHLTYQILTKRPERIPLCLPNNFFPQNVWWGISAEDQENLKERWILLDYALPYNIAPIMFVSAEPLLGPLDFTYFIKEHEWFQRKPDWIIVGGESGPGHRPMPVGWLMSIAKQCREYKIPIFVKQASHRLPGQQGNIPDKLWIQEFPISTDKPLTISNDENGNIIHTPIEGDNDSEWTEMSGSFGATR